MTKGLAVALAFASALLAATPPATAHGATPSREVDTRVLLDDDGAFGYGGCVKSPTAQCVPGFDNTAVDLLNLDVREAYLGGQPAIQFRTVWQTTAEHADRSIKLKFTAGGKDHAFDYTSADGKAFTTSSFDRLDGPTAVGDGHPQALDGWVLESKLGVKPGDTIEAISLESFTGTADGDLMPGQWYANGQVVPHVADDPAEAASAVATPAFGFYKLAGPATLLDAAAVPAALDLAHAPAKVVLTLANPLNATAEFVTLTAVASPGIHASLDASGANLLPKGSRSVSLSVLGAERDGVVNVTLTSDLGAYQVLSVPVKAAPPSNSTGSGSASGTTTGAAGKGAPAPGVLLLAAAVLAAAGSRRRA